MSTLTAGKHRGKIVDYGMKKSQAGNEMVFITFELEGGKRLNWYGSLKTEIHPKSGKSAAMRTVDQMVKLGFNNDWDSFVASNTITCFDPQKEWELVLEERSFVDRSSNETKTTVGIKYINDPDSSFGATEKLEKAQAVSIVHSMNLKGLTMQARADLGAPAPVSKKAVNQSLDQDIPF